MKNFCLLALMCAVASAAYAQNLQDHIHAMQSSYAGSGSVVLLDDHTLLIEPNMPGPMCAVPKNEGGKTTWSFYAFPLATITVPLASVDENLIGDDVVFSGADAAKGYHPGDVGDTTLVVIAGVEGQQFSTVTYDREKLMQLGPGPHSATAYGRAEDKVQAFGLTFASHEAAQQFEKALRNAVRLTKAVASAAPAPVPAPHN